MSEEEHTIISAPPPKPPPVKCPHCHREVEWPKWGQNRCPACGESLGDREWWELMTWELER